MARCARYNIMWWNCQWLAAGRWFSRVLWFPQPIITDRRDITEILLRVALTNTYFAVFSSREYSLNTLVVKTHNNFNPTMHDSSLDWCFIYLRGFFFMQIWNPRRLLQWLLLFCLSRFLNCMLFSPAYVYIEYVYFV
jgi:hypothetical protein